MSIRRLLSFVFAFVSLSACGPTAARDAPGAFITGEANVPLTTVVFSGHRYVADADLGLDKPVPLMVHGNARMFLTLTHEIGERLTGGPVPKLEDYGYSAKGKGAIRVPLMRLGNKRFADLNDVPVFDYIAEGGSPFQGMVGVPFLAATRAAVDFSRDILILGVGTSDKPNARLLASGYTYVRTSVDANHRVTVPAYFPSIDRTLLITPSTVSSALTLHRPPFAGSLPMTRDTTSTDHSPSGTEPDLFVSPGVAFEIARIRFNSPASLEDFAEYADIPESEVSSYGMLGFDWMKEHEAILDYANHFLYFKP